MVREVRTYRNGLWLFLGFFTVFLTINIFIGINLPKLALYHEIFDILIPCLLYLLISKQPIISTLKLNKGIDKESIIIILQLFLVSFLLKLGINYIIMLTGTVDPTGVTNQIIEMVPSLPIFFVAVVVLPMFLEEIVIRGIILNEFTDTNLWQSSIMTGLLFGIMHVDLGQLGYTTALGIIMAAIVLCTGSIWASIFFHFLNNFLTFGVVAIFQLAKRWLPVDYLNEMTSSPSTTQIGGSFFDIAYSLAFALVCLGLGIFLMIHFIKKLQRVNQENKDKDYPLGERMEDELTDRDKTPRKVSWRELFINIPFLLITIIYIGINIIVKK